MNSYQKGFTLIEVMIVITVIGVLTGIAIPRYQVYVAKSQVQRAYAEITTYQSIIEERLTHGHYVISNAELGYTTSNVTATVVGDIARFAADGSGSIEVVLGQNASPVVAGAHISILRSSTGDWSCNIDGSGAGAWKTSYIPPGCR